MLQKSNKRAATTEPTTAPEAKKPAPSTSDAATTETLPPLSAVFATKSGDWECDSCMLPNDATRDKCVACESPKPGASKATATGTTAVSSSTFGSQFAPAASSWECDACMVRNDADAAKCVACETAKPGAAAAAAKPSTTGFSFGSSSSNGGGLTTGSTTKLDSGFASLVAKQSAKWECSACMTRNDAQRPKCECCEQAKPTSAADSSSSNTKNAATASSPFGSATGGVLSLNTGKTAASSSSTFTFGVAFNKDAPAPVALTKTSTTEPAKFTFGSQPTPTATEKPAATTEEEPTTETPGSGSPSKEADTEDA